MLLLTFFFILIDFLPSFLRLFFIQFLTHTLTT